MTVDLQEARARAEKWLDTSTTRETAINEQLLALDVRELVDEAIGLHQQLELATGPHCSSCGNPIDPDWCHCGEDLKHHYNQHEMGHGFCPMGCVCGYTDINWLARAKALGELVHIQRREIAKLLAANGPTHDELATIVQDLRLENERLRIENSRMRPAYEHATLLMGWSTQ